MDVYAVLGLPSGCNDEQKIRRSWRKLTLKWHPDKVGLNKHFIQIQEAYKIICKEIKFAQKIVEKQKPNKTEKYMIPKRSTPEIRKSRKHMKKLQETVEDKPIPNADFTSHVESYHKKRNKNTKIKDVFKFGKNHINKEVFHNRFEKEKKKYEVIHYKAIKPMHAQTSLAYSKIEASDDEKSDSDREFSDESHSDGGGRGGGGIEEAGIQIPGIRNQTGSENTESDSDSDKKSDSDSDAYANGENQSDDQSDSEEEASAFNWSQYMAPNPRGTT
jgi:curved DNA-binding protein CbpA